MKKIFTNKLVNIAMILILTIFISSCTPNIQPNLIKPIENKTISDIEEIEDPKSEEKLQKETIIEEEIAIIVKEEVKCPDGYYESFEECLYGGWHSTNLKDGIHCCNEKPKCPEGLKECEDNECGQGRIYSGIIICCEYCKGEEPIIQEGCGDLLNNENVMFGYPSTEHILERQAYVISHDDNKKVATWVSYHLTAEYLKVNAIRSNKFKADPDIPKGNRAELVDYKGSGYDRGHIAPSADMLRSQSINDESFLLSNMAPQTALFNRGIWKNLESLVRDWARIRESIWIISGPIFNEGFQTIGPNKVGVPQRFFKIVISGEDCDFDAIAFIFSNEKGENPLEDYIISIDDIESETGLDFLDVLEDTLEENIESSPAEGLWDN